MQDATQAGASPAERQQIKQLIIKISPHLNEEARRPGDEQRANQAAALVAQAKQAMARRDYRTADIP